MREDIVILRKSDSICLPRPNFSVIITIFSNIFIFLLDSETPVSNALTTAAVFDA